MITIPTDVVSQLFELSTLSNVDAVTWDMPDDVEIRWMTTDSTFVENDLIVRANQAFRGEAGKRLVQCARLAAFILRPLDAPGGVAHQVRADVA